MRSPNLERAASYRTAAAIARRTGWAHAEVPLADALPADAPFADVAFPDTDVAPASPAIPTPARHTLRLVENDEIAGHDDAAATASRDITGRSTAPVPD